MSEAEKKALVDRILTYMDSLYQAEAIYRDVSPIVIFADKEQEDSFDPLRKQLFISWYGHWEYIGDNNAYLMSKPEKYLKEAAGALEEAISKTSEKYWPIPYIQQIREIVEKSTKKQG